MITSDAGVLFSIFAALFVLILTGRKTGVVTIANNVALALLIVFVVYYFSAPELKKFIQESRASWSETPLQMEDVDLPKESQPSPDISEETKGTFDVTDTEPERKEEILIKNKEQKRMLEGFERKKKEIYERHERFKREAEGRLEEIRNDP